MDVKSVRIELRKLIHDVVNIPPGDEQKLDKLLNRINKLSPDPTILNYVLYSSSYYTDDELDIEAVLDKVFSYKPIAL